MSPALDVREVRRAYGPVQALAGASLTLGAGRITCLLGPSGCGKSTLLRLIAGLEPVDGGQIIAGSRILSGSGTHVPSEQRRIGLVFQDYALFPHLTAEKNVAFGSDAARAAEELARVQLGHRAQAHPRALSGGEQQRTALARALAPRPSIVLLDEPFSGLDGPLKTQVREAALAALRESGAAVLIVTHDAQEALTMADDLALMRAGAVLQAGSPRDCYLAPVSLDAARLLGEANALPAHGENGQAVTAFGPVAGSGALVMARPQAFCIDPEGQPATVTAARFAGGHIALTLEAGGQTAQARASLADAPAVGETVRVRLDPTFCVVFP